MNKERPDEVDAKQVVEKVIGVELEHADINGQVDYRSHDSELAVEVTRVTDGSKRAGREALQRSRQTGVPEGQLRHCWLVFTSETRSGKKTFLQNVHPAIVKLEQAGERRFESSPAHLHVLERGPLAEIYLPLLQAGVERASASPHHHDPSHMHRMITSLGSGGSASGSNDAVQLLCEALEKKTDNCDKLRRSGASQRHLFVWVDGDTRLAITRSLSHDAPAWAGDEFGLPTSAPVLDASVTHLWVVHEGSRRGWLWDGDTWQELRDL